MDGTGIEQAAKQPPVVVTGAGGFIGRHLVQALTGAGYPVVAVTRAADEAARATTGAARVRYVHHPGTAADADWQPVLAGAAAIVHLAGMAHMPVDDREARRKLRRINVLATQRLALAARQAGVRDFIFMSSIKAVADQTDSAPLTEADSPSPQDCYGMAKLATERRLQRLGRLEPPMRILVLRPPLVYGPGAGANFAALAALVARGVPLPLASVRNRRSLLYVGNLTAAVLQCLARADVPSGIFHLSDGVPVSTPELVRALAHAQGVRPWLLAVPVGLLALGARACGRREQAARLLGSLEVGNQHFCRTFAWQPPFSLAQGLQATVSGSS
jgi:nucleoside-diphosphate-sugar epimerase